MLTWKLGVMYVSYTYLLVPIRKHILYIAVLDNIYIYYIYILFYIYNIYMYAVTFKHVQYLVQDAPKHTVLDIKSIKFCHITYVPNSTNMHSTREKEGSTHR